MPSHENFNIKSFLFTYLILLLLLSFGFEFVKRKLLFVSQLHLFMFSPQHQKIVHGGQSNSHCSGIFFSTRSLNAIKLLVSTRNKFVNYILLIWHILFNYSLHIPSNSFFQFFYLSVFLVFHFCSLRTSNTCDLTFFFPLFYNLNKYSRW